MQPAIDASITTPLGDRLLLRRMQGGAALGRLFSYEVELLGRDPDIDASQLLEKSLTVHVALPGGGVRHFNGVVSRFAYSGSSGAYTIYHATLRPWLWLLSRAPERGIYPGCSVPELVLSVLRRHGYQRSGDVQPIALGRAYAAREFFVQYRESAFAFISRLLESEGIYYSFAHRSDGHALVLADAGSVRADPEELPFMAADSAPGADCIDRWSVARPDGEAGSEPESFEGAGNARGIAAGSLLRLTGSPRKQFNREYLVVEARHNLDLGDLNLPTAQRQGLFRCELRAIEAPGVFRPGCTTPRPSLAGPQTASVSGEPGAEIRRDGAGRIQVKFHWDGVADNACWVPVAQPAAGAQFIPRGGQRVVIDFLDADPDRPIVIGSLLDPATSAAGDTLIAPAGHTAVASRFTKAGQAGFELLAESTEVAGLRSQLSDLHISVAANAADLAEHKIERSQLTIQSAELQVRDVRTYLERCGIRCSSALLHIFKGG